MAENRYSQVHTLKNVDVVTELSEASSDRYAILRKGKKQTMDVRLNKQVKIYIGGSSSGSTKPTPKPPVEEPDPVTPETPNPPAEVINPGEMYMLYDWEVEEAANEDKFVLTVNGEGLRSEILENGQLKWTIPAGTALEELSPVEGQPQKYGLSIEGTWPLPVAMTEEVIQSYGYIGIEYNMSYTENFYGIVNYTDSEDTATVLVSIDTEDGLGAQNKIQLEQTPAFVNIKVFIEVDSADFTLAEDQYFTLANLALLPKDDGEEVTP